jgi:hypothetical protein
MWMLPTGGVIAGAIAALGMSAAIVITSRSSCDPSLKNAILRAACKIMWPTAYLVGGAWRLNALVTAAAHSAPDSARIFAVFVDTVAIYAASGVVARAAYDWVCAPPRPFDPHAAEDVQFCRHSDQMPSVAWSVLVAVSILGYASKFVALSVPASR